jgi:hypothetical protein
VSATLIVSFSQSTSPVTIAFKPRPYRLVVIAIS